MIVQELGLTDIPFRTRDAHSKGNSSPTPTGGTD